MYPLYTLPNPPLPMTKSSLNSFVAANTSLSEKRRHLSDGSVDCEDFDSLYAGSYDDLSSVPAP
ncbi:hypothetical protein HanRHA438_Chr09g0412301 [Helianthus annuus]|nr:hypothetical protein HanRHA438_Chr09g0412301 [Helianthus annuus]